MDNSILYLCSNDIMKRLTILVPSGKGNNLSSIVGAYKIFSRANEYWKQRKNKAVFRIELAGSSKKVEYYDGLFSVKPHTRISEINKTDLIIIPSLNHDFVNTVESNTEMIRWIRKQYRKGAEVASICTGAFLLASSGLLDHRSCSTHWSAASEFKRLFPDVTLKMDRLITEENGIYTNGGAYSFLNLIIYLIEKFYDRETATFCSKVFQIDMDRQSQMPFMIFKGQKQHADELVKKAQEYIERHPGEKISIPQLSSRLALNRRSFDRRFIKATGDTPLEYSQKVKIESAKRSFESSLKTVNEVMYDVGYSDAKAFRELFRKITGFSPMEYKSKYQKTA